MGGSKAFEEFSEGELPSLTRFSHETSLELHEFPISSQIIRIIAKKHHYSVHTIKITEKITQFPIKFENWENYCITAIVDRK